MADLQLRRHSQCHALVAQKPSQRHIPRGSKLKRRSDNLGRQLRTCNPRLGVRWTLSPHKRLWRPAGMHFPSGLLSQLQLMTHAQTPRGCQFTEP